MYNSGTDLHAAYALSHRFAIMLNTYYRHEKDKDGNGFSLRDTAVIEYRRRLTELAAGYFTPLRKDSKKSFLQIFGGAAFGRFKIDEDGIDNGMRLTRVHHAQITKIFIQPAVVAGQRGYSAALFSSRISAIWYRNINTDYTTSELDKYFLKDLSASPVFFWEPAVGYSAGFKKLKGMTLNVHTGFTVLLNKRFVDYRTFTVAVGVAANQDLFRRKK